mmetsp:Transcript_672/g.1754  ORF Transcript_672/g.1754 Transcript_672/m.1754 type:complete len:415 (-) Transcript_672:45-1289(-)
MARRISRLAAHVVSSAEPTPGADGVYILAAKRTPIGGLSGSLMELPATELGAVAIAACLDAAGVAREQVQECVMGNVLSAGLKQAPARQAALRAGLPKSVCCTTVNKVCASGMKAVTMGAQSIMTTQADMVVAGGMESMSNVPFYITGQARAGRGLTYGDKKIMDGVAYDGLTDFDKGLPMGTFGELCSREHGISRQEQDEFAARSYQRAKAAHDQGVFAKEIVPVTPNTKTPKPVTVDDEYARGKVEMFPKLRPAFEKDGTVTAASSSTISDGAAALLLASGAKVRSSGLKPLARIVAFADAEQEPERFTTTPMLAIKKALERAKLKLDDIDYFEINEAFAVVVLANMKLLGLDAEKVNVFGGACSLGHPIGCSGARIVATLCTVLAEKQGRFGVAAICNGGGGATALVLERC